MITNQFLKRPFHLDKFINLNHYSTITSTNMSRIKSRKLLHSNIKISPAALWHATILEINLELEKISGSGPKGHILKSDIFDYMSNNSDHNRSKINFSTHNGSDDKNKIILNSNVRFADHALIIRTTETIIPSKEIIQKCLNSINKQKFYNISFEILPDIGVQLRIQNKISDNGLEPKLDTLKISSLLKLFFQDYRHLLL